MASIVASSVSCGAKPTSTSLRSRRRAGLVVDQRRAAAAENLDAIGARGEGEARAVVEREFELAPALDENALGADAPLGVESEEGVEPGDDARPAQRAETRVGERRGEMLRREGEQARARLGGRRAVDEGFAVSLQRRVPQVADLARADLGADRRERRRARGSRSAKIA